MQRVPLHSALRAGKLFGTSFQSQAEQQRKKTIAEEVLVQVSVENQMNT